jgi:serine/threonine protein kinase
MPDTSPESDPSSESLAAVGSVVAGRYRLTRLLGEGGMGAVYEAEHVEIGKRVAIKLVRSIHAKHSEIAARFKREARSASAIESDHIVQVFDAGHDPQLGLFMAMELLRGEDLGSLLARSGRLDAETACGVVMQAASALEKAHTASIVHRDLKPANIFLVQREDQTAMVKLVDFGIAKIVRDQNDAQGGALTRMGSAIGTPNYMSPEQAQGLTTLDHRTDIYSLGAVLYEMIVGGPPFPEMPTYEQTILQILTKPVPRISASILTISPQIDQLVADMMSFQPEQRVGRMREVRERILAAYPGIDRARMLHVPAGGQATSPGAGLRLSTRPASSAEGNIQIITGPGRVAGAGAAAAQAQTNVAVTYDPRSGLPSDESLRPRGVPQTSRTPLVVAGAVVGLLAVVGAIALLRSGGKTPAAAPAAVGLVTPAAPPLSPTPPPHAETTILEPASPTPAPPIASEQEKNPPAPVPKTPGVALPAAKPAGALVHSAPSKPSAKEKPTKTGGQVGGTGISNEF